MTAPLEQGAPSPHNQGMAHAITPDILIKAYASGVFPMAESRNADELLWLAPKSRGIFPLERFHVPERLARTVRQDRFRVTLNADFPAIIRACAEPRPGRQETWINAQIVELYTALHHMGLAHSIEAWDGGTLAGGLYGVALGGAFFGESMFHAARDASKVALVHLAARLKTGGYSLLDAQFTTKHLSQFGIAEIGQDEYMVRLGAALQCRGNMGAMEPETSGADVLKALASAASVSSCSR